MANSLNRNLNVGDQLVLNGGVVAEVDALTFGAMSFTSGICLGVKIDGSAKRVSGYDIDKAETERRFSEVNGWSA